jgi:hypothetical protein
LILSDDESFDDYAAVLRSFSQSVRALESQGYTVTSRTRSVARNLKARGAARSQHLIGTAADFAVPADIPAFVRAAQREGLRVVPELARPGHGPHLHVQLYAKGKAPLAFYRAAGVLPSD